MAYSATVVSSPSGETLIFTDTSTISAPLISRVLTIYDANGTVLQTVNLGATLVYNYAITADAYFTFTEVITDASGVHTVTVNFESTAFYQIAFANLMAQQGCSCNCNNNYNITWAERFYKASVIFATYGLGPAADANIKAANLLINS